MAQLGYTVGQNLLLEYRWTEGNADRRSELARELAGLKLDAIVTSSDLPAQALLEANAGVPIVFVT